MRREEHEIVVSLRDEESEIKLSNDEFGVNKLVEIVTGAVLHAEKAEFRVSTTMIFATTTMEGDGRGLKRCIL